MTPATAKPVYYSDWDGQPISESSLQFEWIAMIHGVLAGLFADRHDVFVAGDLIWYPVEGDPSVRKAPGVMVVFGRPKGFRRFYKQWEEEGIAPQVIFDVCSRDQRMDRARRAIFYEHHGVEEFYLYETEYGELIGWVRAGDRYKEIPSIQGWTSPRLGIKFDLADQLRILRPDGRPFSTYVELGQAAEKMRAAQLRAHGIEPEA